MLSCPAKDFFTHSHKQTWHMPGRWQDMCSAPSEVAPGALFLLMQIHRESAQEMNAASLKGHQT